MVRATLHMTVREGCEREFEEAWREVAAVAARDALRQSLLRDEEPRTYVITSDWASLDAFRVFERSPEQDRLTARLRELRESARMQVNEIVCHVETPVKVEP